MSNRNYKDSVFVDLFAKDIYAKERFISLYNALTNSNLDPTSTEVEPVMLENVLYMKYYNDVSMLVDNKIVLLIEHQSTINENMPFRMLEYIARVYEKIVKPKKRFEKKLIKLPYPEFYVFYNGKAKYPQEQELKLSDAFLFHETKHSEKCNIPLEITVKVVNINVEENHPILQQCKPLHDYANYIELVRSYIADDVENPLTEATKHAIKIGLLSEYLGRKSTEVINMLIAEYDYDTDIQVQRDEAFNDGLARGISQGIEQGFDRGTHEKAIDTAKKMLTYGDSVDKISAITGLSVDVIEELAKD